MKCQMHAQFYAGSTSLELALSVQQTPEFAAILNTVTEYLTASLGAPSKDFATDTPFMEAGLDSLDLLKVHIHFQQLDQLV